MTFMNIRKQLAKSLNDNKLKYGFYIQNGYFPNWEGCEKTDDGLKRESTETRWNAYKSGKISREKCVEYTRSRDFTAFLVRVCYCGGIIIAYSNLNRRKRK